MKTVMEGGGVTEPAKVVELFSRERLDRARNAMKAIGERAEAEYQAAMAAMTEEERGRHLALMEAVAAKNRELFPELFGAQDTAAPSESPPDT